MHVSMVTSRHLRYMFSAQEMKHLGDCHYVSVTYTDSGEARIRAAGEGEVAWKVLRRSMETAPYIGVPESYHKQEDLRPFKMEFVPSAFLPDGVISVEPPVCRTPQRGYVHRKRSHQRSTPPAGDMSIANAVKFVNQEAERLRAGGHDVQLDVKEGALRFSIIAVYE